MDHRFIETIRVEVCIDKLSHKLSWAIPLEEYHQQRIDQTSQDLLNIDSVFSIEESLYGEIERRVVDFGKALEDDQLWAECGGDNMPDGCRGGMNGSKYFKLRVVWGSLGVETIDFQPYTKPSVVGFRAIGIDSRCGYNNYSYKFENRDLFVRLTNGVMLQEGEFPLFYDYNSLEILDTSISNLVFTSAHEPGRLYTPNTYMLNGTRRRSCIESGSIEPCQIGINDILDGKFSEIFMLNAMIDLDDRIGGDSTIVRYGR